MPLSLILSAALVGAAGGLHCVGMCGGLLAAAGLQPRLSVATVQPPIPVAVRGLFPARAAVWRTLGYHLGRISTYALLGALCGALGSLALLAEHLLPVQQVLHLASVLLLVLLGAWLLGLPSPFVGYLEGRGRRLWQVFSPLAARALAPAGLARAVGAGLVWGFVPCTLVYSALALALLAGSPLDGAAVMAAFGLATVPHLLVGSLFARRAGLALRRPLLRRMAGLFVITLAVASLFHGARLGAVVDDFAVWCRTQAAGSISP